METSVENLYLSSFAGKPVVAKCRLFSQAIHSLKELVERI